MLDKVADIASRVAVLLDDPTASVFTLAYLLPFIDQEYEKLDVELERMGMQYTEAVAVFTVSAGVSDLSAFAGVGGPLAAMKFPRRLDWKLPGELDTSYLTSSFVGELDDVYGASVGAQQWRYASGNIQITPSPSPITLRVYFDQVSTNVYDPNQGVIRGTAHILAARVAARVALVRGNREWASAYNADAFALFNAFATVVSMQSQGKSMVAPNLHVRGLRRTPFFITNNGA